MGEAIENGFAHIGNSYQEIEALLKVPSGVE
jgi:hypothetical protein